MRSRGFGLVEIVIALGALAAVTAAAWGLYNAIDSRAYSRGVSETEAKIQKRDNAALQAAIREVETLRAQVAATEKRHADELATKEARSAEKLAQKDRDYDAFIADLNAGRVVFRSPGEPCAAAGNTGRPGESAADPGAGAGSLGRGVVPAPDSDAVFLLSEARRADRILEKLNLCRGVLETERSP